MKYNHKSFIIRTGYVFLDIFFVIAAIMMACWLRHTTVPFPITFKDIFFNSSNPFQFIFVLWIFSVLFFSNIHGLYHTRREQLESIEIWQVTKSVLYSSLLVIVAIYILKLMGSRVVF